DGRERDVRMRSHVDPSAGGELGRAHVIEEDEGPDEASRRVREGAAHGETAEVFGAAGDGEIDAAVARPKRSRWVRIAHPTPLLSASTCAKRSNADADDHVVDPAAEPTVMRSGVPRRLTSRSS